MSAVSSPICTPNSVKSEKYKINSWLSKWISSDTNSEKEVVIDVPEITAVLQALGFKLFLLEAGNSTRDNKDLKDEKTELTITITCGRSGMQAVLIKQDYVCNCPENLIKKHQECLKEENVCNNEDETCCTKPADTKQIIPVLPKRALHLTKEVLSYLLSQKEDINENEEFSTPLTVMPPSIPRTDKHTPNWEVDPKTSPPIGTSSPIPNSRENSQNTDKEQLLVEFLNNAKSNIDKALSFLPVKNNTFTKKNVKRVSDIPKLPRTPTTPITIHTSFEIKSTIKRAVSGTPKKLMSPKTLGVSKPSTPKLTPKFERKHLLPSKPTSLKKDVRSPLIDRFRFKSPLPKTPVQQRQDTPRIETKNINQHSQRANLKLTLSNIARPASSSSIAKPKTGIPSAFSKIPSVGKKITK